MVENAQSFYIILLCNIFSWIERTEEFCVLFFCFSSFSALPDVSLRIEKFSSPCREKPAAILSVLQNHPLTLTELERETGLSRHSLRWHLSRMEEDGIVLRKEEDGRIFYSLSEDGK